MAVPQPGGSHQDQPPRAGAGRRCAPPSPAGSCHRRLRWSRPSCPSSCRSAEARCARRCVSSSRKASWSPLRAGRLYVRQPGAQGDRGHLRGPVGPREPGREHPRLDATDRRPRSSALRGLLDLMAQAVSNEDLERRIEADLDFHRVLCRAHRQRDAPAHVAVARGLDPDVDHVCRSSTGPWATWTSTGTRSSSTPSRPVTRPPRSLPSRSISAGRRRTSSRRTDRDRGPLRSG